MPDQSKDPRLTPYPGGNLGTPLDLVGRLIVPTPLFFVRCNGPMPKIAPRAWRLTIDGFVERPLELSLAELKGLPRRQITAFLECAGNSRTKFDPVPEGTPWINDAVGNATWAGTSLANVLELAGVKRGTVDIVSSGADFDGMQRGLPLNVAEDPDTMLVWEMNGELLTAPHGGPVRLLVPRWAGIASTKWLVRLRAITRPFDGYYNADNYLLYNEAGEALQPVREMPVKSLITWPADGSAVGAGRHTIRGFAWSGFGGITGVEVSTDGGDSWGQAEIVESSGRLSWCRFEYQWVATPGPARLLSRATDERRLIQPMRAPWNLKGYQNNGVQASSVTVR